MKKVVLRVSATGRSYIQHFFKVQYIIIQAILSRKSMKKYSLSIKLLIVKNKSCGYEDLPRTLLKKAFSIDRKTCLNQTSVKIILLLLQ